MPKVSEFATLLRSPYPILYYMSSKGRVELVRSHKYSKSAERDSMHSRVAIVCNFPSGFSTKAFRWSLISLARSLSETVVVRAMSRGSVHSVASEGWALF